MAKILVIDDDSMMLELYEEILSRAGHEVVLAEKRRAGPGPSRTTTELIVVDLVMPNVNGYDFVRHPRALDGHGATR